MFCAPTGIRAIKREDPRGELLRLNRPERLRTLWLAGERCDPDTIEWLQRNLGEEVAIVDHWWQTELGHPCLAIPRGLVDAPPPRHGAAGVPCPGWDVRVAPARVVTTALANSGATDGGDTAAEYFATRTDESLRGGGIQHTSLPTKHSTSEQHHAAIDRAPIIDEADTHELGSLVIRLPMPPGAMIGLWEDDTRCDDVALRVPVCRTGVLFHLLIYFAYAYFTCYFGALRRTRLCSFRSSYTDPLPGYLMTGDAASVDELGYVSVMGRVDGASCIQCNYARQNRGSDRPSTLPQPTIHWLHVDVINVAGHRLSTGAMEAAIARHPAIAVSAFMQW